MPATTNGHGDRMIDSIDPDDPEFQKEMIRPAEIKDDVAQMSSRRRVSLVLKTEAFKEELEDCVRTQIEGNGASTAALQQLQELLTTRVGGLPGGQIIPINDVRGAEGAQFGKSEKFVRCKLAALHRVVENAGWGQNIYNHITARLVGDSEEFLIKPHGVLHSEVTAASLIKCDVRGEVLDAGITTLGINKAGFLLHSAIHSARPDVQCVVHIHTPSVVAVSSLKDGLLPVSQEAAILGNVSYHEYSGIVSEEAERTTLARALGPSNKILFLRNHGVLVCGETVEEAYWTTFNLVAACQAQTAMLPAGLENLIQITPEAASKAHEIGSKGAGGVNMAGGDVEWQPGELEFTAVMRQLDNAGYRTGYMYKAPLVRDADRRRHDASVEYPPVAVDEQPYNSAQQSMNKQKPGYAVWLNSPNNYEKIVASDSSTYNPKKVTKWVNGTGNDPLSPQRGTPIKIDNANQFAPVSQNKKELADIHKKVKKNYYTDFISGGHQSRLLEDATWKDAQQARSGENNIIVGAASKGVIQRDYQNNARVYQQVYNSANPFDRMTDDDLAQYQQEVLDKTGAQGVVVTEATVSEHPTGEKLQVTTTTINQSGDGTDDQTPKTADEEDTVGEMSHDARASASAQQKKKKKKFRMPSFTKKDKTRSSREATV